MAIKERISDCSHGYQVDQKHGERIRAAFWLQLCAVLCIVLSGGGAIAQDTAPDSAPKVEVTETAGRLLGPGTTELGIWAGYSPDNPTLMGRTTNRPYFELDLQYARVLKTGDDWALKYTPEVIPVAIIRQPPQDSSDLPGKKRQIYGFGVTPVGLQVNFRRGSVLQPYINVSGGVLYFDQQVPVEGSSKFNFSLSLGGGLQIWYGENQSVSLGYKYHHISNGYTARQNPGVDSNLYYLECAWRWER